MTTNDELRERELLADIRELQLDAIAAYQKYHRPIVGEEYDKFTNVLKAQREGLLPLIEQHEAKAVLAARIEAAQLIHGRHGIECEKCYDDLGLALQQEAKKGSAA